MADMKYRILGRTGLRVSVMGIGTGGPSKFGQNSGVPEADVKRMVRRGLDLGINFFDSSSAYGDSELILGRALEGVSREDYVLATKFQPVRRGNDELVAPEDVVASVESSLDRLQVDCIDIMQFHGIRPQIYRDTVDRLMPTVVKLKEQGKFRFIGVSETYGADGRHEMLPMALGDDLFDTAMVGYNLLSPTPEHEIFPMCQERNVGVICMVAVRRALSGTDVLQAKIQDAKARGLIAQDAVPDEDPLGWLVKDYVASLPAAAYKYVHAHPAMGTVLSGTANLAHLEDNVKAILGPPLPEEDMVRLRSIFGEVWEPLGN